MKRLLEARIAVFNLEVNEYGTDPCELRADLGRIGEILVAEKLGGRLATANNQKGYDVLLDDGSRVSVKTTARANPPFTNINMNTIEFVDMLAYVQYIDGEFIITYCAPIEAVIKVLVKDEKSGHMSVRSAGREQLAEQFSVDK